MQTHNAPYLCHIMVCVNTREGGRKACGNALNMALKNELKAKANERGWKGKVRVSHSGCLGLCEDGPNVIIYPQKVWYSSVGLDDVEKIISKVEELVE